MFDHSWVFSCYQKGSGLGEKRNGVQKNPKKTETNLLTLAVLSYNQSTQRCGLLRTNAIQ